jgi:hypothetical protein
MYSCSGFALAEAEVIELGPAHIAALFHLYLAYPGRHERKNALDAYPSRPDAAHGYHAIYATAADSYDDAFIRLGAFTRFFLHFPLGFTRDFLVFYKFVVNPHRIADVKGNTLFLPAFGACPGDLIGHKEFILPSAPDCGKR